MTLEKLQETIRIWLVSNDDSDVIRIWNEYSRTRHYDDDRIFYMSELDDELSEITATNVILLTTAGRYFSINDTYFAYNGNGNLESFNDLGDDYSPFDAMLLVNYIIQTGDDFGDEKLREILEKHLDDTEGRDGIPEPERKRRIYDPDTLYHDAEYARSIRSATAGDYSPSNPWNAPGMSVSDFMTGVSGYDMPRYKPW